MPTLLRLPLVLLTLISLVGCGTGGKKPPVGAVPKPGTFKKWLSDRKDPRYYAMYVRRTPSGVIFDNSNRVHDALMDEYEMLRLHKSPTINIEFQDRYGNLVQALVDTSSRRSWATMDAATLMRLEMLGTRTPYKVEAEHVEDPYGGYAMMLPTLRMNNIPIENAIIHGRPQYLTLGPLGRGVTNPRPQMVIGTDLLQLFSAVMLDYRNRTLRVATSTPYEEPGNFRLTTLPLYEYRGGLAVKGHMGDYEGFFLIDTAGDYEIAMPSPKNATEPELWLDTLLLENVQVSDSRQEGFGPHEIPSIGARLLSRLNIVFDFRKNRMIIEH